MKHLSQYQIFLAVLFSFQFTKVKRNIPFVLLLLVGSALFFTIYFKFPNIFHFKTAINVVRGKYDELDHHELEMQHWQLMEILKEQLKMKAKKEKLHTSKL